MSTNFLDRIIITLALLLTVSLTYGQGITTNTGFDVLAGVPIDQRTVINTLSDTTTIDWAYEGLYTHVKDTDEYWRYTGTQWELFQTAGLNNFYISNDTLYAVSTDSTYSVFLPYALQLADSTTLLRSLIDLAGSQYIDTLQLQGDTLLQISLFGDNQPLKELDLSSLSTLVDSTRLTQDSILVYYQAGIEIGRDTITGTGGGGGGSDNLGNHIMTQNLITDGNWISGDGGNEGIGVDAAGRVGIGTLTPSYILDINSTNSAVKFPNTTSLPLGTPGLLTYSPDSTSFLGYYNAQWNRLVDHDYLSSTAGQAASNYWVKSGASLYYPTSAINSGVFIGRTPQTNYAFISRGHGTGSGTYSARFENSTGQSIFRVSDFGEILIGSSGLLMPYSTSKSSINLSGTSIGVYAANSGVTGDGIFGVTGFPATHTSGFSKTVSIGRNFTISSGTGMNVDMYLRSTINQTGTASGATGSIYIDPVLTAAPNWRSIVWTNNTGYGIYGLGTANNYLAGNLGLGQTTPTAVLHIKAGTATANTAPLKFTSGINLTAPEAGAVEWDGTNLFITQTTGPTRKQIAYTDDITAETNDLSSVVTWTNVPDANITQSSVTQHQAALSITESQISDLAHTPNQIIDTLSYDNTTGILSASLSNDGVAASTTSIPTFYNSDGTISTVTRTATLSGGGKVRFTDPVNNADVYIQGDFFGVQHSSPSIQQSIQLDVSGNSNTTSFIGLYSANTAIEVNNREQVWLSSRGADLRLDSLNGTSILEINSGDFTIQDLSGNGTKGLQYTIDYSAFWPTDRFIPDIGYVKSLISDSLATVVGGGASQLSDLTDVNTSTPTNRNVLVADGVDWESRPLVEADISDLQSYLTTAVTSLNGLTGSTQTFAKGGNTSAFDWNSSGSTHTLNIYSAGASTPGVVSTGGQTFAGEKIFTGATTRFSSTLPEIMLKSTSASWTADQKTAFGIEDNEIASISYTDFSGSVYGGMKIKGTNDNTTASLSVGIQYQAQVSAQTTKGAHYFDVIKDGGGGFTEDISAAAKLAVFANDASEVVTIYGNGDIVSASGIASTDNITVGTNLILTNGSILDENISSGNTGEVLSKTATGVDWVDPGSLASYAEMYINLTDPDTISFAGISDSLITETTAGELANFTHSNGRLTYTGSATIKVAVRVSASFTYDNIGTLGLLVYKNGTYQEKSRAEHNILSGEANSARIRPISTNCILTLSQNDYVEVGWETNTASSTVLTTEDLNVIVTKL